jgi:hypothetical protein
VNTFVKPVTTKVKKIETGARDVIGNRVNVVKGKVDPLHCYEHREGEWRYSSTLSFTSALGGVGV